MGHLAAGIILAEGLEEDVGSKSGLSVIDLLAITSEIGREGPLHLTELLERPLFGPVTGHLEVAFTCDGDLDFVSLFEIESFDNHSGKTHSQTIAPFGNLVRSKNQAAWE